MGALIGRCGAWLLLGSGLMLAACAGPEKPAPTATAAKGSGYKIGVPYQIKGRWYYPKEDFGYDRTGVASWYGQDFHGLLTANGETFDKEELSAAHPTLPLTSLVKVTNLDNGRSLVLRINDRGPFIDDRVIDLSQAAARQLGYERAGLARVRVQYAGIDGAPVPPPVGKPVPLPNRPEPVPLPLPPAPLPQLPTVLVDAAPPPALPAAGSGRIVVAELQPALAPKPAARAPAPPPALVAAKGATPPDACVLPAGPLFVQVGAYADSTSARTVALQMADLQRVRLEPAYVNGRAVARVKLGPVVGPAALALLGKVRQLGYGEAFIAPVQSGARVQCS